MAMVDLSRDLADAGWRKNSYSGGAGNDGNCVEIAALPTALAIRDSKAPHSGALVVPLLRSDTFIVHSNAGESLLPRVSAPGPRVDRWLALATGISARRRVFP